MSNKERIKELISSSILFAGMKSEQIAALVEITVLQSVTKGKQVFFEGDKAVGFYMLLNGKVKIFKSAFDGREQILHIYGPGEPFGEVPVFHGRPYPANAVIIEKGEMIFFPRDKFISLMAKNPEISLNMLGMLSLRLRQFANQIEQLSLKEVPGRLANHLIYLSQEQKRTDMVKLEVSKSHLASLLGTTPETLSRIFARMSRDKIIKISGKEVEIIDYEYLLEM